MPMWEMSAAVPESRVEKWLQGRYVCLMSDLSCFYAHLSLNNVQILLLTLTHTKGEERKLLVGRNPGGSTGVPPDSPTVQGPDVLK